MNEKAINSSPFRQVNIEFSEQEHEVIGTYVPITSCYLQNNPHLLDYVCLNVMGIFLYQKSSTPVISKPPEAHRI